MGGKQTKDTIDPNNYNPNSGNSQANKKPEETQQIEKMLRSRAPPNGIITRDKFNEILYVMEELGFPQLRHTPPGYRLFDILSKKSSGTTVSIQDVITFANSIVNNANDSQAMISFQIFDRDEDNIITQEEFMIFVQECWSSAFRNLNMLIQSNNQLPKNIPVTSIDDWANSKKQTVAMKANEEFKKYDSYHRGFWDFNQFKQWAKTSPVNSIIAKIGPYSLSVPLHIVQGGSRTTPGEGGFKNIQHKPQGYNWSQ